MLFKKNIRKVLLKIKENELIYFLKSKGFINFTAQEYKPIKNKEK